MKLRHCLLLLCIVLTACATPAAPAPPPGTPAPVTPGVLAEPAAPDLARLPLLRAYLDETRAALAQQPPVLRLRGLDTQQETAQMLALRDPRVTALLSDQRSGAPFRNEVFNVTPSRPTDLNQMTQSCANAKCYRVELYRFATNETVVSTVNLDLNAVVAVARVPGTQPEIPPHLVEIAKEIATNAPEVHTALGFAPNADAALMAATKTALNRTRCERSQQLCVAPTFVSGERALWAIVNLTEGRLVGVRWTNVGNSGPAITEKSIQNEAVLQFCDRETTVERDGWSLRYGLTSSDGLRVADIRYGGRPLFSSVKLVDWHVSYSNQEGFGYSDAVGCPFFSQAAVIAIQPPRISELRENGTVVGFRLAQEYWSELWPQPCNYYYAQHFDFYTDGRFRPTVASVGRGCGTDGTYRPVTRIGLAGNASIAAWDGNAWQPWATERWQGADGRKVGPGDAEYQVTLDGAIFGLATGRGQFGDGGRGDAAFVYATRGHTDRDEGESDMLTIGPCCNTDEHQGPEQFIDTPPEPIANAPLVLWYVAQLKNDGRPNNQYCWSEMLLTDGVPEPREYPCWSGPLFTPLPQ